VRNVEETQESAGGRAGKFLSITVVTVGIGQSLILILYVGFDLSPIVSNALAAVAVAAIGFVLSVRYVWSSDLDRRYKVEIPAFIALSICGLVLSSVAVSVMAEAIDSPLAVNLASASAYGLLWIVRFFMLDRFIFGATAAAGSTK